MSLLVNKNFEIEITKQGGMIPGGIPGITPTVVESDLVIEQAENASAPTGSPLVVDKMTEKPVGMIMTLGCKSPGAAAIPPAGSDTPTPGKLGAVTIIPGTDYVTANGKKVFQEGDSATCTCEVTFTATGGGVTVVPGICKFIINNPGQQHVEGK